VLSTTYIRSFAYLTKLLTDLVAYIRLSTDQVGHFCSCFYKVHDSRFLDNLFVDFMTFGRFIESLVEDANDPLNDLFHGHD
jgi:hypothetical protein